MNQDKAMQETMDEIERQHNPSVIKDRAETKKAIDKIKDDIQAAENQTRGQENNPSYAQITPEQANQQRKNIVFLKKDLDNLQTEYDQMQ